MSSGGSSDERPHGNVSAHSNDPFPSSGYNSPSASSATNGVSKHHHHHQQQQHGVTQTIRSKLNFLDESKWKKFSARRLELIDGLALSSKKASEQDEQIHGVAEQLRQEYGFAPDALNDFDKLVRAGIQSVRRNRKRQPKGKGPHRESDMHSNNNNGKREPLESHENGGPRKSLASMMTPSPPPLTSSLNSNKSTATNTSNSSVPAPWSHPNSTKECEFYLSIRRLHSYLSKNDQPLPPVNTKTPRNIEFLGDFILKTAAAYALERRFSAPSQFDRVDEIREALLGPMVSQTLSAILMYPSVAEMKMNIGGCARSFGFDATITLISNLFYEMLCCDGKIDLTSPMDLVAIFPHALVNINSTNRHPLPFVRPVTLTFGEQKFDLTFTPQSNTPPTMTELINNGKNAFHIMGEQMVQIRALNWNGKIVDSDGELFELFNDSPRIDLEFVVPFRPYQEDPQQSQKLPPLSSIAQRRYQDLL